jgi:hypothetical protein
MALIFRGSSTCSLCGRVIGPEDGIVATSAFLPPDHPLWRHSDAGMHRGCFQTWKQRAAFVAAFNSIVGAQVAGNATTREMLDDGSIRVVEVDPDSFGSE